MTVSFRGKISIAGKPMYDNYKSINNKYGQKGIYSIHDEMLIDTDCIESINPKEITVTDPLHSKKSFIKLYPEKNLPYSEILTTYIAACQNRFVNISAMKEGK